MLSELVDCFDGSQPRCEENSVSMVQHALKAPSVDHDLKISTALNSLRQLVLNNGLQATPDEEMRELRGNSPRQNHYFLPPERFHPAP
jgi:hypothetical protein